MKRIILIMVITIVLLCSLGAVGVVWFSRTQTTSIYSTPIYPAAQNVRRDTIYSNVVPYMPSGSTSIQGSVVLINAPGATSTVSSTLQTSQPTQVPMGPPMGESLDFDTTHNAQTVLDYYDKWFSTNGWRSQAVTGFNSALTGVYELDGPPDLSQITLVRTNGPLPIVEIGRRHYIAQVVVLTTGGTPPTSQVNVILTYWPP